MGFAGFHGVYEVVHDVSNDKKRTYTDLPTAEMLMA